MNANINLHFIIGHLSFSLLPKFIDIAIKKISNKYSTTDHSSQYLLDLHVGI